MSRPEHFESERDRLTSSLARDREKAVYGLRNLEERWARHLLELSLESDGKLHDRVRSRLVAVAPDAIREAVAHVLAAESWQREIGTWSTGSGEGLASMVALYDLRLARAWMLLRLVLAGDRSGLADARSLVDAIASDPNGLGAQFFQRAIDALRTEASRLGGIVHEP